MVILIPSFNEWDALRLLIPRIERTVRKLAWSVSVLIVDDASSEPIPPGWPGQPIQAIASLSILHLRCNLGHQRAIALGLYHAHEFTEASAVIVMDGDGEDCAEDLPALFEEFERGGRQEAVFAARTKRMESAAFQIFYRIYRVVHRILTGIEVRVGNFSILPRPILMRLMAVSDLWNHYAAAVYRARFPRRLLPLARGRRLAGHSRMNFIGLLIHGLAAISVFSDQISARLLAAAAGLTTIGVGLVLALGWTSPEWRSVTIALLALAAQSIIFATLFALTLISRRSSVNFLLLRDAKHFILGTTVFPGAAGLAPAGPSLVFRQPVSPAPFSRRISAAPIGKS